jgi:hypothetical protein
MVGDSPMQECRIHTSKFNLKHGTVMLLAILLRTIT